MYTAFRKKGRVAVAAVAVIAVVALAGCASSDPTGGGDPAPEGDGGSSDTITIGGFAFPESTILLEIYAQALEENGFDVERAPELGPRQATIPALNDGSIDLIPEYNGNLLAYYNPEYTETATDEIDAALPEYLDEENLQILESSEAQDKDAYVVTAETAEANDLETIGDLANLEPFTLGANSQFNELPYGIPGLAETYGVTDVTFQPIDDFGGPLTVNALVDGTVDVADIYTTSPAIETEDLVVLEDPENLIADQAVVPLLSTDIYSDELAEVLNTISAELTTEDLIALRERVEGDEKAQPATAAEDWLAEKDLFS